MVEGSDNTTLMGGLKKKAPPSRVHVSRADASGTSRRPPATGLVEVGASKASKEFGFRLSDVQSYYDAQLLQGGEESDALDATLEKFDLKPSELHVSPVGLVSVDGLEPERSEPEGAMIPGGGDEVATGAGSVAAQSGRSTKITYTSNEPGGADAP